MTTSDERPDTIPERMRAIADHLDVLQKVLLQVDWEDFTGSTADAAEIIEHLSGTEMQDDLRTDAATIERHVVTDWTVYSRLEIDADEIVQRFPTEDAAYAAGRHYTTASGALTVRVQAPNGQTIHSWSKHNTWYSHPNYRRGLDDKVAGS